MEMTVTWGTSQKTRNVCTLQTQVQQKHEKRAIDRAQTLIQSVPEGSVRRASDGEIVPFKGCWADEVTRAFNAFDLDLFDVQELRY